MTVEDRINEVMKHGTMEIQDIIKGVLELYPSENPESIGREVRKMCEEHKLRRVSEGLYTSKPDLSKNKRLDEFT